MSATTFDARFPSRASVGRAIGRPTEHSGATMDLDTPAQRSDSTMDIEPVTTDVERRESSTEWTDFVAPAAPLSGAVRETPPAVPMRPAPVQAKPQATRERSASKQTQVPIPAPRVAPGAVLHERFLIEAEIARGGTSIVYRARDMLSSTGNARNTQLAIKAPLPEVERSRAVARLRHEFECAQLLDHPGIVHMFDLHCDATNDCFVTMELIEGRPLNELLRQRTPIPSALAHTILTHCAHALSHAHRRGVVHGDFKPANVFVLPDESVRLIDFGAAATGLDDASRVPAATAAYASPEVLSGEPPEPRDDIFSFACLAYELFTGRHPYDRRSSLDARDSGQIPARPWSLSAPQWLALLSALSCDRAQRPADIEALIMGLAPDPGDIPETARVAVQQIPDIAPLASAKVLPGELVPSQRNWGFFLFAACALVVTLIALQRKDDTPPPTVAIVAPAPEAPRSEPIAKTLPPAIMPPVAAAAAPTPATETVAPALVKAVAAPMSEITFESRTIVTSEGSIAAVLLIKRSQPLNNRVHVRWNAVSGTADAGIDFASNPSGTVTFASGQAQRAIYVPLRGDLLKEPDETFTVRLQSPQHARLGKIVLAEATIRDDD